ncbi:MAG: MarR family transcriptional regulator [Chloroflexota bacterium]
MIELHELTKLLTHTQHFVTHESEEALKEHGLSLAKYNILNALAQSGGRLPFSVLVDRLGCVRSNITGLIDRLQEDHLVQRVDHPEDRRMLFAELTDEGRALIEVAAPCHAKAIQKAFSGLTEEQQELLNKLLHDLIRVEVG